MEKILNLGKIDFNNCGRKINEVEITIELKQEKEGETLSICGHVWNSKKTNTICSGQILDDLQPFFKNNKLFNKIFYFWKNYHLNDLHAGTEKQEELLKNTVDLHDYDYKKSCEILEKNNLLFDNGYKYGSAWLFRPIPKKDLQEIKRIIEEE